MKKFKFRFLLVITILAFSALNSFSQSTYKFRSDSIGFYEDLQSFMENIKSEKEATNKLIERFELLREKGKITDTLHNLFVSTTTALVRRRAKAYPHLYQWLNTTAKYIEDDKIGVNFYAYQEALQRLINSRKARLRHISRFIETIYQLTELNIINKNGSTVWRSDAKDYTFRFENEDSLRISFPLSTLKCNSVRDSIHVYNAEGDFDPVNRIWRGNTGTTYWERAGYSRDSVFAIYKNYKIDMQLSRFKADSAEFYNFYFYDEPILGELNDHVTEIMENKKPYFPEFKSYNNNFRIDDIFDDINYIGGFYMRGAQLFGSGNEIRDARIEMYRDVEVIRDGDTIIDKMLFIKSNSDVFVFTDERILTRDAKVVMVLGEDSLYHPGLQLTYLNKNKEITLLRDENATNMSRSPYYDTYHMFEIDAKVVKWRVGSDEVFFTSIRNSVVNNAGFSSFNLFNKKNFDVFQGYDFRHPFFAIRSYLNKQERRTFTAKEIGLVIKQPEHEASKMLLHMTYLGYVDYDNDTKRGLVKDKFYDYLLNVVGKKDYDLINIQSNTEGDRENAILNLKDLNLYVNGVPQVHISDAKRVNIFPKNEEIILKQNRSIDFAGVIETGYYTFFGNNFHFDYEQFGVVLEHIDSLQIKVVDYYDNFGDPVFKKVQSTIENITGNVFIDDPGNKSGIKDNAQYPIFKSAKDSYVYYDESSIAKGVYTRDTFYFRIDPYIIDSLNSFDAQGMKYTGTFYGGEIFPPIDEELQLRPDNSLGFVYETPEQGLPVYKGRGQYYDTISMDNRGLKGSGKLEFLTSTTWAQEFKFYPDTMRTLANRYENIRQVDPFQGPEIQAEKLNMLWKQDINKMYASTTEIKAIMYAAQSEFKGTFYMDKDGVEGHGNLAVEKGRFRSNKYEFLADQMKAKVTDFNIEGLVEETFALKADSIKTTLDFPSRTARFEALSSLKPMYFPINQYKAYLNTFEWAIDQEKLALKGSSVHRFADGDHTLLPNPTKRYPRGALFVSTHPLQYELNYVSPETDIDLGNNFIYSHNVEFIEIADATIYPGDGEFTVKPDARYNTLQKAEILANNDTKYHKFYDVTANVTSRKKYAASGYYDYIDKNKKPHQIRFDIISVDSSEQTFARGKILGEDDFSISPAFKYRGDVNLYAPEQFLNYKGFFNTTQTCDMYGDYWVKFEAQLNPDEILIPIDSVTTDINQKRLYKGIMLEHDSVHILKRFFTPRHHYTDKYITTATGYLRYDENGKKYEIAPLAKLNNPDTLMDYIANYSENCNMYGEGDIDLTGDYGQIKFNNHGKVNYFHDRNELILDLFSTVDFFFTENAIKYMADTLKNFKGLKPVNMLSDRYYDGISKIVGNKMTDQLLNEQKLFGAYKKFPKELEKTFVFSNLSLKWNEKDGTFHSFGDIGITSILDVQVNKHVKGAVQTGTSRTGDYFFIYLEFSPNYWYFFRYKRGIMLAVSSDQKFNEMIQDLKARDRKQKVERGEPKFYYYLGSMTDKNRFLSLFHEAEKEDEEVPEENNGNQDNGSENGLNPNEEENQNNEQK